MSPRRRRSLIVVIVLLLVMLGLALGSRRNLFGAEPAVTDAAVTVPRG